MKSVRIVLLIVALWAGTMNANVISVNFESYGSIENSPTHTAGIVNAPHWNDTWLDNSNNSPLESLRDSTGDATTANVSWVSAGTWSANMWGSPGPDLDGTYNSHLLKGYLDSGNHLSIAISTVELTGIPYHTYDIYVYFNSDVAGRPGSVTDGTTTYYFTTYGAACVVPNDQGGTANAIFEQATAVTANNAVASNYAVFSGLSGASQTFVTDVPQGGGFAGIQIVESDSTKGPHDPAVLPPNPEGSVGVLISNEQAEVTLSWMAGEDPDEERGYPVNPDILGHYIFLSSGGEDDPNVYPLDYLEQDHAEDPFETDPYNEYGPIVLSQGTVYYWQIVQEMFNPATGVGYPPGDPNNIAGPVWTFTTIGLMPQILTHPQGTYVDAEGNALFSVTASSITTDYRWFKVGDPEDIALTDDDIYSGTQTATLTVSGATVAEEGQYYCIAYNGDPDAGGTPSLPSNVAWLWIPRLLIHYPLDTIEIVDANEFTPDIASGFDMMLTNSRPEGALPYLVDGVPELGGSGLFFNNSDRNDPNNAWGQYATAGVVNMEELGNALTISFWVQWVGDNGDWQGIINRRGSWNNANMMWRIDKNPSTGEISFEREGGSGRVAATLVEGDWHQITVTYDAASSTTRMYNNGTLVATGSGFTYGTGVNSGFKLGCNNDDGSDFFYGVLDDVKVYNYTRTTEQIARDYLTVRGEWVCNYELYDLPFDFNEDCRVDLADFAILASTWMESNRIYPD